MDNRNLSSIGDLHVETQRKRAADPADPWLWGQQSHLVENHTITGCGSYDRFAGSERFGRSRKPPDASYTLHSQAEAVLEIIDALGLVDLTVIGHSMGGGVALLVAMALEQRQPGTVEPSDPDRQHRVSAAPAAVHQNTASSGYRSGWWSARFRQHGRCGLFWDRFISTRKRSSGTFVEAYAAPLRYRDGRRALIATARAIIPPDIDRLIAQYKQIRGPSFCYGDATIASCRSRWRRVYRRRFRPCPARCSRDAATRPRKSNRTDLGLSAGSPGCRASERGSPPFPARAARPCSPRTEASQPPATAAPATVRTGRRSELSGCYSAASRRGRAHRRSAGTDRRAPARARPPAAPASSARSARRRQADTTTPTPGTSGSVKASSGTSPTANCAGRGDAQFGEIDVRRSVGSSRVGT